MSNKIILSQKRVANVSPSKILRDCDLLIPKDCVVINDFVYEKLEKNESGKYRVFLHTDDYDYVDSRDPIIKVLDVYFKHFAK